MTGGRATTSRGVRWTTRWSSSGTGQDRQGEWEGGGDGDDDKTSGSDETLSLSYHDKDTAAHHGQGEMLRARTTRQLVSLHACTQ